MNDAPLITFSRRVRPTPFTSRVQERGARAYTVYNRMRLATEFESLQADGEHLRRAVQVWDVSVERQVDIRGPDATRLVQWMTPRAVADVGLDRCVYLPLADENGRLVNDPVGLRLAEDHWQLSISDSDALLWAKGLCRGAGLDAVASEPPVWPLAVQGPLAETLMARVFGESVREIRFFRHRPLAFEDHPFTVARSGWSRQGGFEIYVDDAARGQRLYDALFAAGEDLDVRAGCPNLVERVEGGLLSFGNDMDMRHSPLEAGLESFCSLDADTEALSLDALRAERAAGPRRRLRGLMLPAADGARPLAFAEEALRASGEAAGESFVGSQAHSRRYAHQLATAMLDEPLASETRIAVTLADGSEAVASVHDLPFDFETLGIAAREED